MQPISQAVVERAITLTNRAATELAFGGADNAHDRARIFETVLNHLIYGPQEGDTDAPLSEQTARDNRSAVSGG